MDKQTTAQVAKALNMTRQKLHTILQNYPHLRPDEQSGEMGHHLWWSEAEIAALRAHITAYPRIKARKQAPDR